jgi:hypothetical protein
MDRNITYQRSMRLCRRQLPDLWDNFMGQFQKRFSTKFAPLARIYYHFVLASPAKG